jgi:putative endonuclease
MKNRRQSLGRWGEQMAAAYLEQRGYCILEHNARTAFGELDLVARQGDVLVFVEVKTRSSTTFGLPEASITARKRQHLLSAAQAYLQNHPDLDGDWRVDVIAILRSHPAHPPQISHFENAVT